MYYVIYCEDTADSLEKRRSVRPAHLERLNILKEAGKLLLAGPLLKEDQGNPLIGGFQGSLIIAEFDNIEQAKSWIASDPFTTAGIYQTINVYPFLKVLPL